MNALPSPPVRVTRAFTVCVGLGRAGATRVDVLNAIGAPVALLHDGPLDAGDHELALDANGLRAGAYVIRVVTPFGRATRTVTVAGLSEQVGE